MSDRSAARPRTQLGPYWLWYRPDRDDWAICWYDAGEGGQRRTRRKSTGIGGGRADAPPPAAQDALAEHYAASRTPEATAIADALVENLIADWLTEHVEPNLNDPVRYANSVTHWQRFFVEDREAGYLRRAPVVTDATPALVKRFIAMRTRDGVSPHTIERDIAALRQALNWNWKNQRIASAPFIPGVGDKPGPKELVYKPAEVAAILEAALARPEREHVHLYTIAALSTHGRGEAILELDLDTQYRGGLIYFNAPGRAQTKKRRSIVPAAPTLAAWLEGRSGKLIRAKRRIGDDYVEHDTYSIKKAFEGTLIAAGVTAVKLDEKGEPLWLPPRAKLGETAPRPHIVGLGSPNTLRHTCSTELHARGVPEAQIDAAAGHAGDSTNKRHYRHLRPEYLKNFVAGVEDYWSDIAKLTKAHLRYQRDTKIVDMGAMVAKRRRKNV